MTTFTNPIIPGFSPDPSIVLVGDVFFLVNSSFHLFPGLPIYASRDLRSWRHIGNAINRPNQLDLSCASTDGFPIGPDKTLVATLGLFAPTIRWHKEKGVFYIICTLAQRSDGSASSDLSTHNFYITCPTGDIWTGRWSDPVWFDFQGIDPSLFIDDDGRAYIQGSHREGSVADQLCSIRQMEIDLSSGKLLSETKIICDRGAGKKSDIEGPHMYKKDGWYYLLVADGGTFEGHKARVGKSRSIWGPFDVYGEDREPVVTAEGTNEYVQNVGHADLFQDREGLWWAVALGVRNEKGRFPMGRETFLIPVQWPEDSWPKGERAKLEFVREVLPAVAYNGDSYWQEVGDARVEDVYIRNVDLEDYSFSPDGKEITLVPRQTDLSAPKGTTSFVGRRQRSQTCTASVTLHVPVNQGVTAGLALYKEDFRHVDITYHSTTRIVSLKAAFKLKGGPKVVGEQAVANTTKALKMRIGATPLSYKFSVSEEGSDQWKVLGSIDGLEMTTCDFNGTVFGLFASTEDEAKLQGERGRVRFEDLQVS